MMSSEQKRVLGIALGDQDIADQISAMIDSGSNPQGSAVADIASPSLADAEEVANKVNELLGSLRAAALIDS